MYQDVLTFTANSIFNGKRTQDMSWENAKNLSPIFAAFLLDDDVQEITICSTNIGFVYTLQKRNK